MTAARTLTEADVIAVADELERRRKARRRKPEANIVPSELDRALARKIARRMGLHVREPKK